MQSDGIPTVRLSDCRQNDASDVNVLLETWRKAVLIFAESPLFLRLRSVEVGQKVDFLEKVGGKRENKCVLNAENIAFAANGKSKVSQCQ